MFNSFSDNFLESIISGAIANLLAALICFVINVITIYLSWHNRKNIINWTKKWKIKIFPVNFDIAFSIDFKEGLNSGIYFKEIKKNFEKIINDYNLQNVVRVVDFSDVYKFKNKKEAEKFRGKKDVDLIIWGEFSRDGLKAKGELVNKLDLNFTFSCPNNKSGNLGKAILADIGSKMALKKYWQIFDDNSFEDVKIISNNIFYLSAYIVAITLKMNGRINESIAILEGLVGKTLKERDDFCDHAIFHLKECYHFFIIDSHYKKDFNRGIEYCMKTLNLEKSNFLALNNLAVFQYKLGNKKNAEKNVELMLKLYPKNSITEVNVAFIRILGNRYNNAFKHYENIIRMENLQFNPFEVIEFLTDEYHISKEIALMYGSGIISYYWGDKGLAKKDLSLFMKKSNDSKYKKMRRKVRKLLN